MRLLPTVLASSALGVAVLAAASGCYNTARSRQAATSLTTRMTAYRDEQDARVRQLNDEYRDAFARLMDVLDELSQAELEQARDGDAQQISDTLIADGNASLRGRFRGAFADIVRQQRARIEQADLAVAGVRDAYVKSYSEAKLEIAKINLVLKNLEAVAHDPTDAQQVQETLRVVKIFVDAYEDARKPKSGDASGS